MNNDDILNVLGENDIAKTDHNQRSEAKKDLRSLNTNKVITKEEKIKNMKRTGMFDHYLYNLNDKYSTEQSILSSRSDLGFKEMSAILINNSNKESQINILKNPNVQSSAINSFIEYTIENNKVLVFLVKKMIISLHMDKLNDLNKKYFDSLIMKDKKIYEINKNKNKSIDNKTAINSKKNKVVSKDGNKQKEEKNLLENDDLQF